MSNFHSPARLALLTACLWSAGTGPALGAAFANGSFENGQNVDTTLTAQNASINSWTVHFGDVNYVSAAVWKASAGDRSIDLNGSKPGGISQQFDVEALHKYQIEFDLSGNPDGHGTTFGARGVKSLTVYPCSGTFVNLFKQNQGAPNNCDSGGSTFSYDTSAQANTRAGMKYETQSLTFTTKLAGRCSSSSARPRIRPSAR